MTSRTETADVVIVGGRAAGAATALLLARRGHDVLVVDADEFPSDTVSTHQLARGGVVQLARWGLLDDVVAGGAPALRAVTFFSLGKVRRHEVADKAGVDFLVAPRRIVVDALLLEAAAAAGARVRTRVRVDGVIRESGRVVGVTATDASGRTLAIRARFVVGADGIGSVVARSAGARTVERRGANGAAEYAYYAGVPWDGIELHVDDGGYVGVFPTHGGEACVWVTRPADASRRARHRTGSPERALESGVHAHAPILADRLRDAARTSPAAGMARCPNFLRTPAGPGWALVGDAGYHRDPLTGHGMTDAYVHAELLADALDGILSGVVAEREALHSYGRQRDRVLRDVFEITCAMAAYPPPNEFVALQKQLGAALDREADLLTAREPLATRTCVPSPA